MQSTQEIGQYNLHFISNNDLFKHVRETVKSYRTDIEFDLTSFNKNKIDPIKFTFDYKVYRKEIQTLIDEEVMRQIDKTNNNAIGYFHQNIFRYVGGGWSVPSYGFDIENVEKNIFVEMKNKHNTMNSSSSQKTYIRM